MEREKQPRGNGEQAAREEVTAVRPTVGKWSLCAKLCGKFISEELFAVRKAIKHSSPRKRCKQSLGGLVFGERRGTFEVNLMATEGFLFISEVTGFSIYSHIFKDPTHLK